jgi:CDP-diacylglycerol--glycerol-3-phosphate 3-phosphatidyltransferase
MSTLRPATARQVRGLYALKPAYARVLEPVLRWLARHDVHPDVVSAAGVCAALAAGATLAVVEPGLIASLAVTALVAVRLACANLDGNLARRYGQQRPIGGVVNELGDRLADLAVVAGIACHLPAAIGWAMLALSCAPSWVALAVAAQGGHRRNGGPVGKTERGALACVVALTGWFIPVAVVIGAGSALTAAVRLRYASRDLVMVSGGAR